MIPLVVVLSSPSGGGKSTIAGRLLADRNDTGYSVSATTRSPRPGEVDGREYYFMSPEEFAHAEAAGEFLEHAEYNGHRYGTLEREVRRVTQAGKHVLLDIEVVGARLVRQRFPDPVLVFVLPPSARRLVERLQARGTDDPDVVADRLRRAEAEIAAAVEYDYLVVNDELDLAVAAVSAIIDSESRRTNRHRNIAASLERLQSEMATELTRMAQAG